MSEGIRDGQFEITVGTLLHGPVKVTCETQARCRDALVACFDKMITEELEKS